MRAIRVVTFLASVAEINAFVAPRPTFSVLASRSSTPPHKSRVPTSMSAGEPQIRHPPGEVKLDEAVLDRYMALPQGPNIQAEYIWIGGSGHDLRCKTRTLDSKPTDVSQLPLWNYDGSSCGQAPGDDSEVMLKPVKIYPVSANIRPSVDGKIGG